MELGRGIGGALAGGIAAAVWAAQQPLDKRIFRSEYDDLELLGKLVTRDASWPVAGFLLHVQNGAVFGAGYAVARPFLPGPLATKAVVAALGEHLVFWPLGRLVDRHHPARRDLVPLSGNRRAFAQSAWRHLVFGLVLGELERRFNAQDAFEPPEIPISSNGHGNIEQAAVGAT
jgi:hypothetical protein